MLFGKKNLRSMWERVFKVAMSLGEKPEDAEDMASKAVLAFMECDDEVNNPEAYANGVLRNLRRGPRNGRHRREIILEDPHRGQVEPRCEMDDGEVMLRQAAALQHVLHFGRRPRRGTTALLTRASRIDPGSVEMAFIYINTVLARVPVAPKTRRKGKHLYGELLRKAEDRVTVDRERMPDSPDAFARRPEAWVGEDAEHELSGNATEAVKLLRLLFPTVSEPEAIDLAVAVEQEVWRDRDRGVSHYMFLHSDDYPPEDEDRDALAVQLKGLWKWEDGGELVLTVDDPCKIDLKVTARDRAFLVQAPTGEQCFGAPLPAEAEGCLLEALEYDPPDEEVDAYYTILEPQKADHIGDVAEFILDTLLYAYGWNPNDGVEWVCEYDGWEA